MALSIPATTALLASCLLALLLAEGNALSCVACSSSLGSNCTGTSVNCPAKSDACVTKYTETTTGGSLKKQLQRSCGVYTDNCNKIESFTGQSLEIRGNSTCCTTDNCQPAMPTDVNIQFVNVPHVPHVFMLHFAKDMNVDLTLSQRQTVCCSENHKRRFYEFLNMENVFKKLLSS
ncbi:phospholipase A2 inhibitor gamma subunit B-like [Ambystoma mexicanum]|uniref:phospholipase A2 inhibitor gamma subunit B-like n=1 Tax=Ambystoma mexicanum TaxID=8296 RepID=UPI0037E89315